VTRYNHIAGQSTERLAALSDGVFAVAMTLLVLDLHIPAADGVHTESDLIHLLASLAPRLLVYMLSFLSLGIFWVGQQTQINYFARSDRDLTWVHLGFLFVVSLMPFSTALMAEFFAYRTALVAYWLNILFLGLLLLLSWYVASAHDLVKEPTPALTHIIKRRILVSQALYAGGAALCVFGTRYSLGCIILVQLYYALAPAGRRRPAAQA